MNDLALNILNRLNRIQRLYQKIGLRSIALVILTIAISYRGGLWLTAIHNLEGATERNEPPLLIHWLRDSTLMLPLIFAAVLEGILSARWLVSRFRLSNSSWAAGIIVIATIAILTSFTETAASPLHDILFQANDPHEAHNHSGVGGVLSPEHLAYDSVLVLSANLLITAVVFALLGGKFWLDKTMKGGFEEVASDSIKNKKLIDKRENIRKALQEPEQPITNSLKPNTQLEVNNDQST